MPRGTGRYDEARLQGRLWDLTNAAKPPGIYINTNRLTTCVPGTSGGIQTLTNLGSLGSNGSFTQGTASSQPTPNILNGNRRTALFTTTQNQSNLGSALSSVSYTIMILARFTPGGTQGRIMSGSVGLYGHWHGQHGTWFDGTTFLRTGPTTGSDGVWHLIVMVSNGGTPSMREDGADLTGVSGTVAAYPTSFSLNVTESSACEVAAFAVVDGVWGTNDIYRAEGALLWEFGLQGSLAAAHPFANRPPLIGA